MRAATANLTISPGWPAPTLHTERLQLVAPQARHFDAFAELHCDPDTMQYIGDGKPLDRVGAWLQLATLIGHWQLRGYGVWVVEDRATGRPAGRAGLLHPQGWAEAELNWMVLPSFRGQGYATEAAGAALYFAFHELSFERLTSLVRPGNEASLRVATKLGGTIADTVEFMGGPMHVVHYHRPDT